MRLADLGEDADAGEARPVVVVEAGIAPMQATVSPGPTPSSLGPAAAPKISGSYQPSGDSARLRPRRSSPRCGADSADGEQGEEKDGRGGGGACEA